jgi:ubiquinone/menaquinone biosynthesis C-methylase UbiE
MTAPAWLDAGVVAGFATSPPNSQLIAYAAQPRCGAARLRILDIGCGAGRNAVPLARAGADVIGTDLSEPMLRAAQSRSAAGRLHLAMAQMDALPVSDHSFNFIVAHGIWNLARSGAEFRKAVAEAARAASPGAALFVFTFSRHTLPADAVPIEGETFVFTQFSGSPQVFLTRQQLVGELHDAGFEPDPALPIRELNLPPPGQVRVGGAPVIYEAAFRKTGA